MSMSTVKVKVTKFYAWYNASLPLSNEGIFGIFAEKAHFFTWGQRSRSRPLKLIWESLAFILPG